MRVLIVGNNLLPGGAERVIIQLLSNWVERGVECGLTTINKLPHYYDVPGKVEFHELDVYSRNPILNKLRKYWEVRRIVKRFKPDVVLSLPEEIGIYVLGATLGLRVPVVVSERNNPWVMPNKKPTRILRRLLYPFASGLIFQTKQAASFFSPRLQRKGIVLPNPLDLTRIHEPHFGEREKFVVGAGRLEPQKNFALLIDAFAEFYRDHPDYRLVVYGEGGERKALERRAAEKLPEGAFSFPGRATDLLERMNKAAAFVLSSDFEGVPNVLIEAMASGVPCVSTDCAPGGAAELIDDGKNGFLVPVGDAKVLSEKLAEVVDHPEIAAKFASESVKVKEKLDAEIVCDRWLRYLRSTIK